MSDSLKLKYEIVHTLGWVQGFIDCARHNNEQLDVYHINASLNGLITIISAHEGTFGFYGMRALEEIGIIRGYIIDSALSNIQRAYLCEIIDNVSEKITEYYRESNAKANSIPNGRCTG